MKLPSQHTIRREAIKLSAYRLICLFYGNIEISRHADPDDADDSIAQLEKEFLPVEMTKLLIEVAISYRMLDDQCYRLDPKDAGRKKHELATNFANRQYQQSIGLLSEPPLTVREACNKIIHAFEVSPEVGSRKDGSHVVDYLNADAYSYYAEENPDTEYPQPDHIQWKHLTGFVRLAGKKGQESWNHLLNVPVFIRAMLIILNEG